MMWKRKKKEQQEANILDLVPEKALEWELDEEGRAIVLKPRFSHPFMVRHLMPRLKSPNFRVRLDQFGSSVWSRIDGVSTVREIAGGLREEFGKQVEPVPQRLGLFFRQLHQGGFISFSGWPDSMTEGQD